MAIDKSRGLHFERIRLNGTASRSLYIMHDPKHRHTPTVSNQHGFTPLPIHAV